MEPWAWTPPVPTEDEPLILGAAETEPPRDPFAEADPPAEPPAPTEALGTLEAAASAVPVAVFEAAFAVLSALRLVFRAVVAASSPAP